ncbi:MAG TPA: TolC family protein, partial [Nitrospira sp.]|nr:TolC family protein [Nitrospira sp.]
MRPYIVILVSLLTASCLMGPEYERPAADGEDRFRMAETSIDAPSMANLPWWELLKDEQLQNLVRIALAENKDLHRAAATVEEFQARAWVARSDFLPSVTATGNAPAFGRKTVFLVPGFPNPFNYYLQGNLSWEVDFWGRIRRSNEAARADLLAREENRRAVVLELVSSVAEAYFNVLQFDAQLVIAKRTLQSWEESVRIAQARLRQGMTSKLDADQFEAERANAAARTAELERQMIQAENQLSVLLGRKPFEIARGKSLGEQALPPTIPPGLPSELLQRR